MHNSQLVHQWKNVSTAKVLTKHPMPAHLFHRVINSYTLQMQNKNIIVSEVTFDVPFVEFTPGTICCICWLWSLGTKCLTDSQHQVREVVYIVASLHQHSDCVYLGKNKYRRDLPTIVIICELIHNWLLQTNNNPIAVYTFKKLSREQY